MTALLSYLLLAIVTSFANAQTPAPTPNVSSFVFVPYDSAKGPALDAGQSILIPYAEFLQLKTQTPAPGTEIIPAASIASVVYTGEVTQDVAIINATITVEVIAKEGAPVEMALPLAGIAIESATTEGAPLTVTIAADKPGITLRAVGPGQRTVRLKFATPINMKSAERTIEFSGPRAAAASFELKVPGKVSLSPNSANTPATVTTDNGISIIKGFAGISDHIAIAYTPEIESAAVASAPLRFTARSYTTVRVSSKSVGGNITLYPVVVSGTLEKVRVQIPEGVKALNIDGATVKSWSEDADHIITVQLSEPAKENTLIALYLQYPDVDPAKPYDIPEITVPDALQQTGTITIAAEGAIALWTEQALGVESTANLASDIPPGSRAYRFSQPGWKLTVSQRALTARIRTESTILYEVTNEEYRIKSRHLLTVSDQGVFDVVLAIPDGYTVREVGPNDLVSGFRQDGNKVRVSFRGEQRASATLTLRMAKTRETSDRTLTMTPVRVEGAEEESGSVILAAASSLRISEKSNQGVRPTDPRTAQDQIKDMISPEVSPILGYRYTTPSFEVAVSVEAQRTLLTSDTTTLVSLEPALMRVNANVNYRIEFSSTDTFYVLVPQSAGEDVRFEGSDIKEKSHSPFLPGAAGTDVYTTWTVKLQRPMFGSYNLGVGFDEPLTDIQSGKPQSIEIPKVMAGGVAREQSQVGITRGENLEVSIDKSVGYEARDTKELPPYLASASLAFRTFEPAKSSLTLNIVRHEIEAVLAAVIRRMHIDTVVSDQGDAVHEAIFEIQNNHEQYLELKLPPSMEIWSAFVAGSSVRSTTRASDGVRMIELAKSKSNDDAFRVRIVLREKISPSALMKWGKLTFAPIVPVNIPVLRFTRRLYLPREFTYVKFGGSMHSVTAADAPWAQRGGEELLNQIPASVADAIPEPNLNPPQSVTPASYDATETELEKQARLQGSALEIPITREGSIYDFSMISGVGDIEASYWKRRSLFFLQAGFAAALFLLIGFAARALRKPYVAIGAVVIAFAFASLTTGLTARLSATALATTAFIAVLSAILYAIAKARTALKQSPPEPRILYERPVPSDPVPPPAPPAPAPAPAETLPDDTQPPTKL
ncbi:MAG: hypothetical protein ABI579_03580 [Candidatus Sumerlaeota bacterium]